MMEYARDLGGRRAVIDAGLLAKVQAFGTEARPAGAQGSHRAQRLPSRELRKKKRRGKKERKEREEGKVKEEQRERI